MTGTRAIVLLVISLTLTSVAPAGGITGDGNGNLDPGGNVDVGITVTTPGVDSPVDLAGHTSTQPITWTVVDDGLANPGDLSGLCAVDTSDPAHPVFGWIYHLIGRALDGTLVPDRVLCVPFTDPAQRPPPPGPPQLPTIEEVWRQAHLPTPVVGLDPASRGITGLDTRIWTETRTTLTISASLGGYSITGTATVTGYTVQVDDEPVVRTRTGGNAADPVVRYVFETKGEHRVRIGAVWRGIATFSGPDLNQPLTISIGDATIAATRMYPVHEIRSVLQP